MREFVQLTSSWPPARVEGGARAAVPDTTLSLSASSGRSAGEFPTACFGATLHHFCLLWGLQNGQKACFGATLHHSWLLSGTAKRPKSFFGSNTPSLLATLGTPQRPKSLFLTNTPSLFATLGIPKWVC